MILLAVYALTACGDDTDASETTDDAGDDMTQTANDHLVCGLIDTALVKKVIGDGEIGTRGRGVRPKASRLLEPASCTVQNLTIHDTVMNVSIGEVEDPEHWRRELQAEAADEPGITEYTGDPGVGYGRTYDHGVRDDGASVNVLRGDRLIRATVYHWRGVTPQQRLALAEDIARNMDQNVTEYDESHAG